MINIASFFNSPEVMALLEQSGVLGGGMGGMGGPMDGGGMGGGMGGPLGGPGPGAGGPNGGGMPGGMPGGAGPGAPPPIPGGDFSALGPYAQQALTMAGVGPQATPPPQPAAGFPSPGGMPPGLRAAGGPSKGSAFGGSVPGLLESARRR